MRHLLVLLITLSATTLGAAGFGYWGGGSVGAVLFGMLGFTGGFPLATIILDDW